MSVETFPHFNEQLIAHSTIIEPNWKAKHQYLLVLISPYTHKQAKSSATHEFISLQYLVKIKLYRLLSFQAKLYGQAIDFHFSKGLVLKLHGQKSVLTKIYDTAYIFRRHQCWGFVTCSD